MVEGEEITVESVVKLGPIPSDDVVVEIALGSDMGNYISSLDTVPMQLTERVGDGTYRYVGKMPLAQGTYGYTVRIRPDQQFMIDRFEMPLVRWADGF